MSESKKTTIAASPAGFETLARLKGIGFFETELAAFLATASLAIAMDLEAIDLPSGATTKWNKGSGDIQQWLRIAPHLVKTNDPAKDLERFGEAGLRHVADRLDAGDGFADIFVTFTPAQST